MSEEQQSKLLSTIMGNITRDVTEKLNECNSVIAESDVEALKRICDTIKTDTQKKLMNQSSRLSLIASTMKSYNYVVITKEYHSKIKNT